MPRSQQSQPSSQSQLPQAVLNGDGQVNIDEVGTDIVLFFLTAQKSLKPIKKNTLLKHFKRISGKIFNDVMDNVKTKLLDIYGLKIIEKEDKTISYILVNALADELDLNIPQKTTLENNEMILLLTILCVIYKNGGRLKEDSLFAFLQDTDIIHEAKKPIGKGLFFGMDIEKFIRQELTGMLYLMAIDVPGVDVNLENNVEYMWGIRAEKEVSYEKMDKFFEGIDEIEIELHDNDVEDDDLVEIL